MINNWLITGDTHGRVIERLTNIDKTKYIPTETAIIILGDAGINFYLNKTDKKQKIELQKTGFTFYCVRGNHEERPENISSYFRFYDETIQGYVFMQKDYPNIRFFIDGYEYNINGYSCLVIGGAYSVDKWYRIAGKKDTSWTGWFKDEQLTKEEMNFISNNIKNKSYDFIFSHTCPISWEPTDLFLNKINQSSVDKTMELWLDEVKNNVCWDIWLFGHYHADRLERPHVEIYYRYIESIDTIYNRWKEYDASNNLDYWIQKSPSFYLD